MLNLRYNFDRQTDRQTDSIVALFFRMFSAVRYSKAITAFQPCCLILIL